MWGLWTKKKIGILSFDRSHKFTWWNHELFLEYWIITIAPFDFDASTSAIILLIFVKLLIYFSKFSERMYKIYSNSFPHIFLALCTEYEIRMEYEIFPRWKSQRNLILTCVLSCRFIYITMHFWSSRKHDKLSFNFTIVLETIIEFWSSPITILWSIADSSYSISEVTESSSSRRSSLIVRLDLIRLHDYLCHRLRCRFKAIISRRV